MKTRTSHQALALVGLAALAAYILACTSFSPDDSKVLYPAFDASSGRVGVAMYDRETRRSQMVFLPVDVQGGVTNADLPSVFRAQWLDARRILVDWAGDALAEVSLPSGSCKLFVNLPERHDKGVESLMFPTPIAGDRVFMTAPSNELVRLDLRTGAVARHSLERPGADFGLFGAPGENAIFYSEENREGETRRIFGRLDPETFQRTPLLTFTNELAEGSFFTYDPRGRRAAFIEAGEEQKLVVLESGKPAFTRNLGPAKEVSFGNAVFSRKGDLLLASFRRADSPTNSSFGLMEIPLNSAPVRQMLLLRGVAADEMTALYFQVGVSHDGKTAAVASTYLACIDPEFKAGDCALFFVSLTGADRKVTRVPIPLPAKRSNLKHL